MFKKLLIVFLFVFILVGTAFATEYEVQEYDLRQLVQLPPIVDLFDGRGLTDHGIIVGKITLKDPDGSCFRSKGFTYNTNDGFFSMFQHPEGSECNSSADPWKSNNLLQIGGMQALGGGIYTGYIYQNGFFTDVLIPEKKVTITGINNLGTAVGFYYPDRTSIIYQDGVITEVEHPVYPDIYFYDINDSNVIVGSVGAGGGQGPVYGIIFENGNFTAVNYPGSVRTEFWGINNAGDIVGSYKIIYTSISHGFIYKDGNFESFDYSDYSPDKISTWLVDINDFGQILGLANSTPGGHFNASTSVNFIASEPKTAVDLTLDEFMVRTPPGKDVSTLFLRGDLQLPEIGVETGGVVDYRLTIEFFDAGVEFEDIILTNEGELDVNQESPIKLRLP